MKRATSAWLTKLHYFAETATCESCGKVGKRDTFFSTTKRFCGVHCSHSFSAKHRKLSQQKAILTLSHTKKKRRLSIPGRYAVLKLQSHKVNAYGINHTMAKHGFLKR